MRTSGKGRERAFTGNSARHCSAPATVKLKWAGGKPRQLQLALLPILMTIWIKVRLEGGITWHYLHKWDGEHHGARANKMRQLERSNGACKVGGWQGESSLELLCTWLEHAGGIKENGGGVWHMNIWHDTCHVSFPRLDFSLRTRRKPFNPPPPWTAPPSQIRHSAVSNDETLNLKLEAWGPGALTEFVKKPFSVQLVRLQVPCSTGASRTCEFVSEYSHTIII